ncbi:SipW-dependent-type signal peptide-containing protein [Leucobacter sp. gxy201]|uniref:SipW-dependent-type signal peptide-containing protein n=1 Tax=Leucobacter sp. gxy201 TaxID=2957200 RepID=UPI003DA0D5D5
MSTSSSSRSSRRNRKIAAVAAGLLVVGVGATYTLASWNDSEWVWGGADGDPGIGTSTFEVQQNTDPALAAGAWTDEETPAGGELQFTVNPTAMVPDSPIYAPVSLRTVAGSIAGDVTLQGATPNPDFTSGTAPTSPELWAAMRVSVYTSSAPTAPNCTPAAFDTSGWGTAITDLSNVNLNTIAGASQNLPAGATSTDPGAAQHYCFVLTLPGSTANIDDLQGKTIAPMWKFESVSN